MPIAAGYSRRQRAPEPDHRPANRASRSMPRKLLIPSFRIALGLAVGLDVGLAGECETASGKTWGSPRTAISRETFWLLHVEVRTRPHICKYCVIIRKLWQSNNHPRSCN